MMNKQLTCPVCGSTQVTRFEKETLVRLTLGNEFSYKDIYYHCGSCSEEGDFSSETDKNYLIAQKEAQVNFVKQVLDDMNKFDITMAMLERVFELPPRTLTRWKNGDFSSSALALLRIIVTFPWIIQVAENRFEKSYSKYAVITAAAEEFKNATNPLPNVNPQTTAGSGGKIIHFKKTTSSGKVIAIGG